MWAQGIQMNNGRVFEGERIEIIVEEIIDKLAEENLSVAEAKIVLQKSRRSDRRIIKDFANKLLRSFQRRVYELKKDNKWIFDTDKEGGKQ